MNKISDGNRHLENDDCNFYFSSIPPCAPAAAISSFETPFPRCRSRPNPVSDTPIGAPCHVMRRVRPMTETMTFCDVTHSVTSQSAILWLPWRACQL